MQRGLFATMAAKAAVGLGLLLAPMVSPAAQGISPEQLLQLQAHQMENELRAMQGLPPVAAPAPIPVLQEVYNSAQKIAAALHCNLIDQNTADYSGFDSLYKITGTTSLLPYDMDAWRNGWNSGYDATTNAPGLCTNFNQAVLDAIQAASNDFVRNNPVP